jgi:transglutaminase-like putative cysteine protease
MVDRAQMYYPKKAMCLQHSAVVTYLLRRRGVPAEMVLAAQEFPPKAHAWAEVLNEVVSDSPTVKMKYRELRRL